MKLPIPKAGAAGALLACSLTCHAQVNLRERTEILETPTVEVVGAMPVPGLGMQRFQMPSNVAGATAADLARSQARDLPAALAATLPGVVVDQAQGNAHQADVIYRGFVASPRLGIPQGLSVFLDGARINEPFGDIVHWNLVPRNALASATLVPGSNPLFGLNTLGGALALRTKSGEHFTGGEGAFSAGSFGHRALEVEHGGNRDGQAWYVAANAESEDGWRDHSPSRIGQLFVKLGRQGPDHDLDLSLLAAKTNLTGNQLTPGSFLQQRREAIYTYPDNTRHELFSAILNGNRWLGERRLLAGNAYLRVMRLREANADLNEVNDRRFGVVPFEDGTNDGVANVDSAVLNRVKLDQASYGLDLNHTWLSDDDNRLTLGAALDHARSGYIQSYQLGIFNVDRSATATRSETELVNLDGRSTTLSAYLSTLTRLAAGIDLTAAARANSTRVRTIERSRPQPAPALGLNNDFRYNSLNPAIGVTWDFAPGSNAYAGLNRGTRAPSPIELGCADRNSPCLLSNAFGSDPYLKQVRATTLEAGLRGKRQGLEWQFGAYRTELLDDIHFVSAGGGQSRGYFSNVGVTQRQGLELALSRKQENGLSWSLRYNRLDATFRSGTILVSQNNSKRDTDPTLADDEIRVRPGDVIPGMPRHQLQLAWNWNSGAKAAGWSAGTALRAQSRVFVRGNENNQHRAGTVTGLTGTRTFTGSGEVAGYAVVDLTGEWRFDQRLRLGLRIANLFDRRYATGGILGENAFPGGRFDFTSGNWTRETLFSPGSPRSVNLNLAYAFD
jgi:outer membrane receptor protein involved in Fe transport